MYFYIKHNNHKKTTQPDEYLLTLKTYKGAIRHAIRNYTDNIEVYTYTNIYDDTTYKLIFKN